MNSLWMAHLKSETKWTLSHVYTSQIVWGDKTIIFADISIVCHFLVKKHNRFDEVNGLDSSVNWLIAPVSLVWL